MPDFDTALDRDWRDFRSSLADRLADLPKGARFELSCPDDPRYGTCIECRITGHNRIRIELDIGSCPVNTMRLGAAGWKRLRSGAFVLEVGRRRADLAAAQVAGVLREEWGILHPVFVFGHGGRPEARESRLQIGVEPRNADHLQKLLDDAIDSLVCGPQREACKCIRFEVGGLVSWLRVLPGEKVLEFFTWLGPSEVPQSAHVIAEANARCRGIQVAAAGDRVFAALHVDAAVFIVADLSRALSRWLAFMSDHSGAIAHQLESVVEADQEPAPLPPGLQCLLHLDPDAATVPARCRKGVRERPRRDRRLPADLRRAGGDVAGGVGRGTAT